MAEKCAVQLFSMPILFLREKGMKLYVRSKEQVESYNDLTEPHIIISINWPPRPNPIDADEIIAKPTTNEYTKEVLFLYFSDVGRLSNLYDGKAKQSPYCVPFDLKMASQVIDLIERNKVEHIIIHCLNGISRSASMAHAIAAYFDLERPVSWIVINELVYITMLEELIKCNILNYAPVV